MADLIWTFPVLLLAAVLIGWAAEITAIYLSASIALAILAWLQTAPEFAVEATIAWNRDAHLALANLTGSIRLLMGLGWPLIFFIHWLKQRKNNHVVDAVTLPQSFAVEAAGLAIPVLYFVFIAIKATWTIYDGIILISFYFLYFWMLNRQRQYGIRAIENQHTEEDEAWVVRKILKQSSKVQKLFAVLLFFIGGTLLWISAHPFVEALKVAAFSFGISEFVFIQWVAPVASEFPEKVTAFNWARKPRKVPLAIVNMLSSITSQWTLLAGLVPILFSLSAGQMFTIHFNEFQRSELLLTIAQSALAVFFLTDLKIKTYEAFGLFILWFVQFVVPSSRQIIFVLYTLWCVVEVAKILIKPSRCIAWTFLRKILFS